MSDDTLPTYDEWRAAYTEDDLFSPEELDQPTTAVPLAALSVGPNADAIARFLGMPRSKVRPVARTMRENGYWIGSKLCIDGKTVERIDILDLTLMILVAEGMIVRKAAP